MRRIIGILLLGVIAVSYSFTSTNNVKAETETGIQFEPVTFAEAKQLAKESGKLIFVDCYTLWCGPCKRMAATSFKDERVAEIYNEQFINIKVEMEKDADGPEMARLYKVQAYPTLLILDSNGKVVKQILGGQTADGLLNLASSVAE